MRDSPVQARASSGNGSDGSSRANACSAAASTVFRPPKPSALRTGPHVPSRERGPPPPSMARPHGAREGRRSLGPIRRWISAISRSSISRRAPGKRQASSAIRRRGLLGVFLARDVRNPHRQHLAYLPSNSSSAARETRTSAHPRRCDRRRTGVKVPSRGRETGEVDRAPAGDCRARLGSF